MRNMIFMLAAVLLVPLAFADFEGPGGCKDPVSCKEYCATEGKYEECRRYFESQQSQPVYTTSTGMSSQPTYSEAAKEAFSNGPGGCSGERECRQYCSKPDHYDECKRFASEKGFYSSDLKEAQYHYEGVDPVMMIVGKMFEGSNLDPKDFISYCPDSEAMVDAAIAELKAQGKWDIKSACGNLEDNYDMCKEHSSNCKQILNAPAYINSGRSGVIEASSSGEFYSDFTDEEIITCDELSEDVIYESCLKRSQNFAFPEQESCEQQWERQKGFSSFECPEGATGCLSESDLKEDFIASCDQGLEQAKQSISQNVETSCRQQVSQMYPELRRSCSEREYYYEQCLERSGQACSYMKSALDSCNALTEEDIRTAMVKMASRFCGFKEAEDEQVELRGQDVSMLVKHLQDARDQAPEEYKPLLDEESEDLLEAAGEVNEIEDRGIGYKLRWFVGAAAENEKRDAAQLRQSAEKLQSTIDALRLVLEELDDENLKTIISDQISELEDRVAELEEAADDKEKRAKGFLSYLGIGD